MKLACCIKDEDIEYSDSVRPGESQMSKKLISKLRTLSGGGEGGAPVVQRKKSSVVMSETPNSEMAPIVVEHISAEKSSPAHATETNTIATTEVKQEEVAKEEAKDQ